MHQCPLWSPAYSKPLGMDQGFVCHTVLSLGKERLLKKWDVAMDTGPDQCTGLCLLAHSTWQYWVFCGLGQGMGFWRLWDEQTWKTRDTRTSCTGKEEPLQKQNVHYFPALLFIGQLN